jgi:hypothetical protein
MIKFTKERKIHPCYLSVDDLRALVLLINTDFPESNRPDDFQIRTSLNGVYISEHSLENFLNHDRLPPILTRLMINVVGWSSTREIDKNFDITFYDNYIDLRVSGFSESWVNGKFLQVVDFLKKTRPSLWLN